MTEDATHVGYGRVGEALFFVIPAMLGAGIGLALHFLLGWLLGDSVRLQRDDLDGTLRRSAVASVFLDGKEPVRLGPDTNELARDKTDQSACRIEVAFTRHGFPWHPDGDPREADYRMWSKSNKLGVVVRDRGGKQYWRLGGGPDQLLR